MWSLESRTAPPTNIHEGLSPVTKQNYLHLQLNADENTGNTHKAKKLRVKKNTKAIEDTNNKSQQRTEINRSEKI